MGVCHTGDPPSGETRKARVRASITLRPALSVSLRENPAHSAPPNVPSPASPTGPPGNDGRPNPLDAETLERIRRRDPEALGALFDRYFDSVFGLVFRLLGDRTLAEDAASEVFVKVYRAAHQLDSSRDPAPWLMTIATNVCRDLWRSGAWRMNRRSHELDDPVAAAHLTTGRNDPEQDVAQRERERAVQDALTRLPEPLRVAIVLHDYEGLSHQQIAEMTGIEHAAARKRYSRALAALARELKGRL